MYEVEITPETLKELRKITKLYSRSIKEIIEELEEDPHIGKSLSRELTGKFSYRIGVHRLTYLINEKDKKVIVISAGHRSTAYQ